MIKFANATMPHTGSTTPRACAVVGDTLGAALGGLQQLTPELTLNVTAQPDGSDVFDGLGTAGDDVGSAEAMAATLTHDGLYTFAITAGEASTTLDVAVFPAEALTLDRVAYQGRSTTTWPGGGTVVNHAGTLRQGNEARAILRSVAMHMADPSTLADAATPDWGVPGDLRQYGG
jgi:hypothetical protein